MLEPELLSNCFVGGLEIISGLAESLKQPEIECASLPYVCMFLSRRCGALWIDDTQL